MTSTRLGAVIVPAHQEGDRVGRCVEALAEGWVPGELDVVVVSNGSTDDTVAVVRERAAALGLDLRVLDLPEPGKVGAIRAGEEATSGPRLYLDADCRCAATTARVLLQAVGCAGGGPGADVAVPSRVLDLSGCSLPARLYHRAWADLPWVREQLAGRGAYALSEHARSTFGVFPQVTADDRFATTVVPRDRAVVVDAPVHVVPAATLREVLVVRRRVFAGNAQLAAAGDAPAHDRSAPARLAGAVGLLRRPSRWPGLAVWAGVTVAAKLAARRGAGRWRVQRSAAPASQDRLLGSTARPTSLAVVVVTYRSAATVRDCLLALQQAAAQVDVPVSLVVVDNASDDASLELVRRTAPEALVVSRDVNDGFGRACAAGVEATAGDAVLFCNPDVVVAPGALRALLDEVAEHPGAAVVGGKQLRQDGSVDPRSWWHRPTWWSALCFASGLSSALPGRRWSDPESAGGWDGRSREVGAVSGGFMLVRRAAWQQLGGFDDDMLLYGEDLDLCLRAYHAGMSVRVCGGAEFRHDVGGSSRAEDPGAAPVDAVAFRLQLVLRGRATVARRHLGRAAVVLLQLGVGLRAAAAPVGSRQSGGRRSTDRAAWAAAWRGRRTWREGWRPADDLERVLTVAREEAQTTRAGH